MYLLQKLQIIVHGPFFVLKFHDDHDLFVLMHMFVSLCINAKFEGCLPSI